MVAIQPWVFITTCWSRQYDFNLVCHPTPKIQFFFLFRKKCPQAGFKPKTPTTNPKRTHNLDALVYFYTTVIAPLWKSNLTNDPYFWFHHIALLIEIVLHTFTIYPWDHSQANLYYYDHESMNILGHFLWRPFVKKTIKLSPYQTVKLSYNPHIQF